MLRSFDDFLARSSDGLRGFLDEMMLRQEREGLGEFGDLAWLDLSPKGAIIQSRAKLFNAPETWTLPALSRGLLYVSQNEPGAGGTKPRLICYDLRAP